MNWYLAKIVYQIICGDGTHTAQFDEQVRLVIAGSKTEALEKSSRIGLQEEEVFYNNRQQVVRWKYINVAEIVPLDNLTDGAEVYSQIKETEDAEAYRNFVNHKAGLLHKRTSLLTAQTH